MSGNYANVIAAVAHPAFSVLDKPWFDGGDWSCRFKPVRVANVEVSICGKGKTADDACCAALEAWTRADGESKRLTPGARV